jgi:VanZ family protein
VTRLDSARSGKVARGRFALWLPVAAYMAAIFYVSSLHEAPLPQQVSDKSAHALAYVGLGLVVTRALARGLPARITLRIALASIAIATAYGASDEFHQLFVAGRSADLYDLMADSSGAALATAACWLWGILSIRSRSPGGSPYDL